MIMCNVIWLRENLLLKSYGTKHAENVNWETSKHVWYAHGQNIMFWFTSTTNMHFNRYFI